MKALKNVSSSWDSLAKDDAMDAVLTGSKSDESEFYATGERDVNAIIASLNAICPNLQKREALDFGCGLGRLTFPLADHFGKVVGVDISEEMLKQAAANQRKPRNVDLLHNDKEILQPFAKNSFDFVLSLIVLQHVPRRLSLKYISEFLRITRPGGTILFQAVTQATGLKASTQHDHWKGKPLNWDSPSLPKLIYRASCRVLRWIPRKLTSHRMACYLKLRKGETIMQMNPIPRRIIERAIAKGGGEVLDAREDKRAGSDFESIQFIVRKKANTQT